MNQQFTGRGTFLDSTAGELRGERTGPDMLHSRYEIGRPSEWMDKWEVNMVASSHKWASLIRLGASKNSILDVVGPYWCVACTIKKRVLPLSLPYSTMAIMYSDHKVAMCHGSLDVDEWEGVAACFGCRTALGY